MRGSKNKISDNVVTHCDGCKKETNHTALYSNKITETFDFEDERMTPLEEQKEYMVVQCKGCDTISFVLRESGEHLTDTDGNLIFIDNNYPERNWGDEYNFLTFAELDELPSQLRDLYEELVNAFENGSNKLAGVGLRMLVEAICIEQKITIGNLKEKIEKLHLKGLLSKNETPILDKLREVGNASVHGIKQFPLEKLQYALDILNHVLKSIYILPKINRKLKL